MEKSVSAQVWAYVRKRPFLKEMLRNRFVNYSSLARAIATKSLGDRANQNAVKMALVRLARKIDASEESFEVRISKLLRKSSLAIKNRVAAVTCERPLSTLNYIASAESGGTITYMLDELELDKIRKIKSIVRIERNLSLIEVKGPSELIETPGFLSHILSLLSGEGINVVELISCHSTTSILVRQSEAAHAHELISAMME